MSGLLAVDPGEPGAGEAVEEKQARCPGKQRLGVRMGYDSIYLNIWQAKALG